MDLGHARATVSGEFAAGLKNTRIDLLAARIYSISVSSGIIQEAQTIAEIYPAYTVSAYISTLRSQDWQLFWAALHHDIRSILLDSPKAAEKIGIAVIAGLPFSCHESPHAINLRKTQFPSPHSNAPSMTAHTASFMQCERHRKSSGPL